MTTPAETPPQRLEHYPVTFFAIGMGMFGLALASHAAETAYGASAGASTLALWLALILFAAVTLGYLAKALRHPAAVHAEWNHPIRVAFFPAMSISLLLMATALLPVRPDLALTVWICGTLLQGVLSLAVIGSWIGHRPFQPGQLTPAWFIPAVGNVIVPVAGAPLGYPEVSWLFMSAGLVFWLVLLTLVMNRLMFHDPIPGKLVPTLMILIAPPAVAFVAWLRLTGEVDAFGRILLNLAYVFGLVVATQLGRFRAVPFALSWWALSFPLAALAIASFAYAGAAGSVAHLWIGTAILVLLVVVIVGLLVRTAIAIAQGRICLPE